MTVGNWSYLSLDKLKASLDLASTNTNHDAALRRVLEAVSEQVDAWTERTFRVYLATRYYTARYDDRLDLDADLLSVTTLKTLTTNSSGVRTYGDTWATTDYDLLPDNAAVDRRPYTRIVRNPEGAFSFPTDRRGVEITGKWGYWEDLETISATLAEDLDATETGVDVSDGTQFDVLDTILIDSEQMYVTSITANTLTVVRGVNGTTAATHTLGASIRRYRYPAEVAEAVGIQAARLFNRGRNSPLGISGSPEVGVVLPRRLDADIRALLEPYRWVSVAGAL